MPGHPRLCVIQPAPAVTTGPGAAPSAGAAPAAATPDITLIVNQNAAQPTEVRAFVGHAGQHDMKKAADWDPATPKQIDLQQACTPDHKPTRIKIVLEY